MFKKLNIMKSCLGIVLCFFYCWYIIRAVFNVIFFIVIAYTMSVVFIIRTILAFGIFASLAKS